MKSLLWERTATPVFSKYCLCHLDVALTLPVAEDTSTVLICQLIDGKLNSPLKQEEDLLLVGHEQMTALLFLGNQYQQATCSELVFHQGVPLHWRTCAWNCCISDTISRATRFTDRNATEHGRFQPKVYKWDLMIDEWLLADKLSLFILCCVSRTSLIVPHIIIFLTFFSIGIIFFSPPPFIGSFGNFFGIIHLTAVYKF